MRKTAAKTKTKMLAPCVRILFAAEKMDWQQVVLNGGPPCFHIAEGDRRFCGRAQRWHDYDTHKFVSLADLIRQWTKKQKVRK